MISPGKECSALYVCAKIASPFEARRALSCQYAECQLCMNPVCKLLSITFLKRRLLQIDLRINRVILIIVCYAVEHQEFECSNLFGCNRPIFWSQHESIKAMTEPVKQHAYENADGIRTSFECDIDKIIDLLRLRVTLC